jgi:sugar phosphate isomerase/epimerase
MPAHLTYCLNVHPGESWAANFAAIRNHTLPIRDLVSPSRPFGLGLRLSHQAALTLESPDRLEEFRQFLLDNNLYVFTINGFPYGNFHGAPVKSSVYSPDWHTTERLDYTLRLARLLAVLLPENIDGSISTVPLTYSPLSSSSSFPIPEPRTLNPEPFLAHNLADLALALHKIQCDTGRELHLGLEPEPDCLLATPDDAIRFFETILIPLGAPRLAAQSGCSRSAAESLLLRHIGICLDTCHMAVEFLSPADSIDQILKAGIRLSKLQLSAAIETNGTPAALTRLRDFCEPVYLHQTRIMDTSTGITSRYPDLAVALAAESANENAIWRTHFHIPLNFEGNPPLRSTSGLLDDAFWKKAQQSGVSHYEIESYTFSVLPPDLKAATIEQSVAREFEWTQKHIQQAPSS